MQLKYCAILQCIMEPTLNLLPLIIQFVTRQIIDAHLKSQLTMIAEFAKGASIYDISNIFGFFDPLPPPLSRSQTS